MKLQLFAHPFSAYCQKVLIALYENDTPFELRLLDQKTPEIVAEWSALWPLKRMPVLQEGDVRPCWNRRSSSNIWGSTVPGPSA